MTTDKYPLDLSYGCIDIKPIDYEFSSERWSGDSGEGWRVCEGSVLPDDLETQIRVEEHGGFDLELDPNTLDIYVTTYADNGDEEITEYEPGDDDYDRFAAYFKLDGEEIRRVIDGDDREDWEPMMNYAYPLGSAPPDDWKTRVCNCTCVEIDGNAYLALTGGGMDMSWEICESYMRLGYFPPAHFASDLPRMSGRGTSERDKWILAGCRVSLEGMRDRIERALSRLDEHTTWAEEDEARREQRA